MYCDTVYILQLLAKLPTIFFKQNQKVDVYMYFVSVIDGLWSPRVKGHA